MVKRIVLLDKIYNISTKKQEAQVIDRYKKYLFENIKGFANTTVNIRKLRDFDKR